MVWIFLLIVGAAGSFALLGMLSVWVKILSAALSVVLVAFVAAGVLVGLRSVIRK